MDIFNLRLVKTIQKSYLYKHNSTFKRQNVFLINIVYTCKRGRHIIY